MNDACHTDNGCRTPFLTALALAPLLASLAPGQPTRPVKNAEGASPDVAETRLQRAPTFVNRLRPFKLFSTTTANIRKALGPAPTQRAKEGECCGDVLCYLDESGRLYVEFQFGPSGAFERLTGYRLTEVPPGQPTTVECGRSSRLRNVVDAGAVHVGDPAEKLATALGVSGPIRNGRRRFIYQKKVPFTEAEKKAFLREGMALPEDALWDLVYWVDVVVKDGLVRELDVARTETY